METRPYDDIVGAFLHPSMDRKNDARMDKLSRREPEGVLLYTERRSLFIAKGDSFAKIRDANFYN